MPDRHLLITIDGPAGAGKSTISRRLAGRLGLAYLDTGALYRAVAWALKAGGKEQAEGPALLRFLENLDIRIFGQGREQRVWVSGREIGRQIREPEISQLASAVSKKPEVRAFLLAKQRAWAQKQGLVAEGRDMGTVVFPQAAFKFFLEASLAVRSQRRFQELLEAGHSLSLEKVRQDMSFRDQQDQGRSLAPLQPAPDARVIDTTDLTIDQVLQEIIRIISGHPEAA
jgi:cytidylate kinase